MVAEAKVPQDTETSRFSTCEQQEQPDTDEFHQQVGLPVTVKGDGGPVAVCFWGKGGGIEAQ